MSNSRYIRVAAMVLAMSALGGTADSQGKGQGKEQGQARAAQQGAGGQQEAAKARGNQGRAKAAQAQANQGRGNAEAQARGNQGQGRGNAAQAQANQGRGNAAAQARGNQGQGQGNATSSAAPGRVVSEAAGAAAPKRARFARDLSPNELRPSVRPLVASNRASHRLAGKAVGLAHARGISDGDIFFSPTGDRVVVQNRGGQVLLDMNDDRARSLGFWRVVTMDDRVRNGSPAFCRSGAGHPVWGRQWCLDKGFGLGSVNNVRWGRTVDPVDVVLQRRVTTGDLTRDILLGVLGDVAFNRLATHALTLGYVEPLSGRWIGEPTGPQVLVVSSGRAPVAELVDLNRDGRADLMYVGLRSW
jgi:hypothetical protein